jgi:poly-gamma-glutamate synthesis protein (capsule biosynthesis protein)
MGIGKISNFSKISIMKKGLTMLFVLFVFTAYTQEKQKLNLVFGGDIMVHGDQLRSAWYDDDSVWNFRVWFDEIDHLFKAADLCVANLEVPLGVKPFLGYPSFGSPAALASDLKDAGFNVLMTSNNHSSDRGKAGIIRTREILDSLEILNTGVWKSKTQREALSPLIIEEKGFKLAFLNYTYGTNAAPFPDLISHMIEYKIKQDIELAKSKNPDKIFVFMHWGLEYQSFPSDSQKKLAEMMFDWGADYIIGAHPHVIQPMEWTKDGENERFVAWSLGNVISNMYFKRTDGGALLQMQLEKSNGEVKIASASYLLMYVYKYLDENEHIQYRLLPMHEYIEQAHFFKDDAYDKMLKYKSLADPVMEHNVNVPAWP